MGSIETRFGYWSDAGQDEVDDYLEKRYPRAYKVGQVYKRLTRTEQRKKVQPLLLGAYRKAIADKRAFKRFSKAHVAEGWPSPTKLEFKHHVAIGLGLTHTGLLGGRPELPMARRKRVSFWARPRGVKRVRVTFFRVRSHPRRTR
jgi:hypothetical protein